MNKIKKLISITFPTDRTVEFDYSDEDYKDIQEKIELGLYYRGYNMQTCKVRIVEVIQTEEDND